MNERISPILAKNQFIQVRKAAKILDCSSDFIHQLIREKKITAINLGERATRVSSESLLNYIQESRIDPEKFYEN